MTFSVVILEDEIHSQETLADLLDSQEEFELVGLARSIIEVQQLIPKTNPDLVFCDVKLPPHTSFDWLMSLEQIPFEIIFTTSFEEFAVKAFQLAAVDYLLKPINPDEFESALEKFKQRRPVGVGSENLNQLLTNLNSSNVQQRIALPTFTGFLFVPISEIIRCESDNTYTTFFFLDRKEVIVSRTLKDCERMLSDHNFYRVHNSHLVNTDHIVEYIKGDGGQVKMIDGSYVDISRRRKDQFLRNLK